MPNACPLCGEPLKIAPGSVVELEVVALGDGTAAMVSSHQGDEELAILHVCASTDS